MIYLEYDGINRKYHDAQRVLDELLDEKEALFAMTQPGAVRYDKDRVSGGSVQNAFENYVIAKERSRIDERIEEQKQILIARQIIKEELEKDLRASKSWHDKIYVYAFLEKLSLTQIENRVPYSRVQIWRILKIIRKNCDNAEKYNW